jgi:hypothetical protein
MGTKFTPEFEAKLQEHRVRSGVAAIANADALPGPLAIAFGPEFITVGKYQVRQIVAYDFAIWKRIDSPIHRQMLWCVANPDAKPEQMPEIESTIDDKCELVFQLTRPCLEVARLLNKGLDAFKDATIAEIGAVLTGDELAQLCLACFHQITNQQKTMVAYGNSETSNAPDDGFGAKPGSEASFLQGQPQPATV